MWWLLGCSPVLFCDTGADAGELGDCDVDETAPHDDSIDAHQFTSGCTPDEGDPVWWYRVWVDGANTRAVLDIQRTKGAGGGETHELALWAQDPEQYWTEWYNELDVVPWTAGSYTSGSTTRFDCDDAEALTYKVTLYVGAQQSCTSYGHYPEYFSECAAP